MIVLHEPRGKARGSIAVGVVALEEDAALVREDTGLDNQDALEFSGDDVHGESGKLSR